MAGGPVGDDRNLQDELRADGWKHGLELDENENGREKGRSPRLCL